MNASWSRSVLASLTLALAPFVTATLTSTPGASAQQPLLDGEVDGEVDGELGGELDTEVVPPPPPAQAPWVGPGPVQPAPAPPPPSPGWIAPQTRPGPELLPAPMPFMLGFGFAVLGGFGVAGTTAVLLEAPSVDGDLVGLATLSYVFSAAFAGVGLVLMVGGLTDEVKLYSRNPGWAWTAAIFSALGGLGAIAALVSWQVDGQFGADSIGYTLAAAGCYGLTLLVFLGLDEADDPATRVGLVPLPGGGALQVAGRF